VHTTRSNGHGVLFGLARRKGARARSVVPRAGRKKNADVCFGVDRCRRAGAARAGAREEGLRMEKLPPPPPLPMQGRTMALHNKTALGGGGLLASS